MKIEHRALLLGLIAAASFWVLDAALSFLFFHEETFLDLLILKVSPHHLFRHPVFIDKRDMLFADLEDLYFIKRIHVEIERQG